MNHTIKRLLPCALSLLILALWGSLFQQIGLEAAGTIHYVTQDPGSSTWSSPYTDLQDALAVAVSGDEIWVAAGIYLPGSSAADSFVLKEGVALYGGFDGTESSLTERDWEDNLTILSGDIGGDDMAAANGVVTDTVNVIGLNSERILIGSGVSGTAVVDGFTINAASSSGLGGGLYNFSGSPTLRNLTFIANKAQVGGGIANYARSAPTLRNVVLINNRAFQGGGIYNDGSRIDFSTGELSGNSATDGGGIFNLNSSPIITEVLFVGNTAADGGGMFNTNQSNPTLTDVTFKDNAASNGGGMANTAFSDPTLNNATFEGNRAGLGGAIWNEESKPTLNGGSLIENLAERGGGMANTLNSNPTLVDTRIEANEAGSGGGIANSASSPTLMDVLILENQAVTGGGMTNDEGSHPQINGGRFEENEVSQHGGGMVNANSSPILQGVVFRGNTAAFGGGISNFLSASPEIQDGLFEGNSATNGGGMANYSGSSAQLTNVRFFENIASASGGGFYNSFSNPILSRVAFRGNEAGAGGGFYSDFRGEPHLENVLFAGNRAQGKGGGIATIANSVTRLTNVTFSGNLAAGGGGLYAGFQSVINMENTIVWANAAESYTEQLHNSLKVDGTAVVNITFSLVEGYNGLLGFAGGTGNLDGTDPANNPQFVTPIDPADAPSQLGDFRLVTGSPAIDVGNNTVCPAEDLEGNLRPVDGDSDNAAVCDMGAYETSGVVTASPLLSIADSAVLEGDASAQLVFTITLSAPADASIMVDVRTISGTAEAGVDYQPISTTITIPANSVTATVEVAVVGDDLPEADESFTLVLSNPVNGEIGDGEAEGMILNDDYQLFLPLVASVGAVLADD